MRTPEQEALLRELLFILPEFVAEYRRMAKWLAEAKPAEEDNLNRRREEAENILSMVRRVSVDYDALRGITRRPVGCGL